MSFRRRGALQGTGRGRDGWVSRSGGRPAERWGGSAERAGCVRRGSESSTTEAEGGLGVIWSTTTTPASARQRFLLPGSKVITRRISAAAARADALEEPDTESRWRRWRRPRETKDNVGLPPRRGLGSPAMRDDAHEICAVTSRGWRFQGGSGGWRTRTHPVRGECGGAPSLGIGRFGHELVIQSEDGDFPSSGLCRHWRAVACILVSNVIVLMRLTQAASLVRLWRTVP